MQDKLDLINSTKKVFDECAPIYLKEDKHWGCDLDIISRYVNKFEKPEVIDLGTGHAWHLANLFYKANSKLKRAVGVDYSSEMLERAKELLNSYWYRGRPVIENVELKKGDILSLPFEKESFDVAFLLNNTLGNIPGKNFKEGNRKREKALTEVRRILRNPGYLIISVYNSEKITEEDKYGDVFILDYKRSDFEGSNFVIRYEPTGSAAYSHWFTLAEIMTLLSSMGFNVIKWEKRNERIVLVASKIAQKKC